LGEIAVVGAQALVLDGGGSGRAAGRQDVRRDLGHRGPTGATPPPCVRGRPARAALRVRLVVPRLVREPTGCAAAVRGAVRPAGPAGPPRVVLEYRVAE